MSGFMKRNKCQKDRHQDQIEGADPIRIGIKESRRRKNLMKKESGNGTKLRTELLHNVNLPNTDRTCLSLLYGRSRKTKQHNPYGKEKLFFESKWSWKKVVLGDLRIINEKRYDSNELHFLPQSSY